MKFFYYLKTVLVFLQNLSCLKLRHGYIFLHLRDKTIFKVRNIMDLWVVTETYLSRDYEKHGTTIKDHWTIIDIGAAFGDFSILAAKRSPKNKVYAIEPLASSYALLQENIHLNRLKNVYSFPLALSSKYSQVSITENKNNYGHSHLSPKHSQTVTALSLDKFFSQHKITTCHFLKCDCEGSEYDIFLNLSPKTYKKIKNICMEYHLFSPTHSRLLKNMVSEFKKNSFTVTLTSNPVHSNIGFLFAHKN